MLLRPYLFSLVCWLGVGWGSVEGSETQDYPALPKRYCSLWVDAYNLHDQIIMAQDLSGSYAVDPAMTPEELLGALKSKNSQVVSIVVRYIDPSFPADSPNNPINEQDDFKKTFAEMKDQGLYAWLTDESLVTVEYINLWKKSTKGIYFKVGNNIKKGVVKDGLIVPVRSSMGAWVVGIMPLPIVGTALGIRYIKGAKKSATNSTPKKVIQLPPVSNNNSSTPQPSPNLSGV